MGLPLLPIFVSVGITGPVLFVMMWSVWKIGVLSKSTLTICPEDPVDNRVG